MSVRHMARVWELDVPNPTAKLVLLCLADCMNAETGRCFPSRKYICEACGISPATAKRQLTWLEQRGLIQRETRFIDGRQTTSMIMLNLGEFEGGAQIEPPGGVAGEPPYNQKNNQYSPKFLEAWAAKPRHPNDNKSQAWEKWRARVNGKINEDDLLAAWLQYVAWVAAGGASSPRFMLHMKTFFGPHEHWLREWREPIAIPEDRIGIAELAKQHAIHLPDHLTIPQARQELAKTLGVCL